MPHSFNISKSVRKRIYEYYLVVGEFAPFSTEGERKILRQKGTRKPDVALLLVHPWITAEGNGDLVRAKCLADAKRIGRQQREDTLDKERDIAPGYKDRL